jgi:putative thioredoxin
MSGLIGMPPAPANTAPTKTNTAAPGELISDSNIETFGANVIEASETTPVIVDFWAPWCGPCKTLGPMLENAVTATGGKVRMVKVNIDENQELAAQMKIQSIPMVYAFHQGRPVDGFQGAVPESQIKEFVGKMAELSAPSSEEEMVADAVAQADTAFENGDTATAGSIYQQILGSFPDNLPALVGFVSVLLADDKIEDAENLLGQTSDELRSTAEIKALLATIKLRKASPASDELLELKTKWETSADDFETGIELSKGLAAQEQKDEAIAILLEIIAKDKDWNEQAARKQLLEFFKAFGFMDPATVTGRRKLSSLLFT